MFRRCVTPVAVFRPGKVILWRDGNPFRHVPRTDAGSVFLEHGRRDAWFCADVMDRKGFQALTDGPIQVRHGEEFALLPLLLKGAVGRPNDLRVCPVLLQARSCSATSFSEALSWNHTHVLP